MTTVDGVATIASAHSVDETLDRLQKILEAKSVHIFAVVDHSGEAEKAGLRMPNTKLLIFGNPKGGTPLMLAAPTIAIDLPMKILIWEDGEGHVSVSYNSPEFLSDRHHLPAGLMQTLAVAGALADQAAH
ncbi:MAG: DUF302 domain-containing protein [Bryobacteraceae bacterium]